MNEYWIKSDLFEIEPGEDQDCNPRMYGRQLALWLKKRLERRGYDVEPVINEDWGRCLMCSRNPFDLWVGIGNVRNYDTEREGDPPPASEDVLWHIFVSAEVSLWARIFKRFDTSPAVTELGATLQAILQEEKHIRLSDEHQHYHPDLST